MWFRFDWPAAIREVIERDGAVGLVGYGPVAVFVDGCGMSGCDESDCLTLVREQVFQGAELPDVRDRVPDVDVSTVPEHLREHLGNPSLRGVWYPELNLDSSQRSSCAAISACSVLAENALDRQSVRGGLT